MEEHCDATGSDSCSGWGRSRWCYKIAGPDPIVSSRTLTSIRRTLVTVVIVPLLFVLFNRIGEKILYKRVDSRYWPAIVDSTMLLNCVVMCNDWRSACANILSDNVAPSDSNLL